jgi:hypothetical protein
VVIIKNARCYLPPSFKVPQRIPLSSDPLSNEAISHYTSKKHPDRYHVEYSYLVPG